MRAAQRGMIFGGFTIILFFVSFGIGYGEKTKITTILLTIGGAIIGTSAIPKGGLAAIQSSFTVVIILGFIIIGLGTVRVVQKSKIFSN